MVFGFIIIFYSHVWTAELWTESPSEARIYFPFLKGQDEIWLLPDQRDASSTQLSHFNFFFNRFFQAVTSLLPQLTSDLDMLILIKEAVVFVVFVLLAGQSFFYCDWSFKV